MNFDSSFQATGATAMPLKKQARRIQISLKGLLLLMTGTAVLLGCFAAPELFAIAAVLAHFVIAMAMLISAIFAKGWFRCFAIGFLPVQFFTFCVLLDGPARPEAFLIVSLLAIPVACIGGGIAGLSYSFLARRGFMVEPPRLMKKWLSNPNS